MEGGDFEATHPPGSGLKLEGLNAYPIRPGDGGECPRRFQLSRTSITFKQYLSIMATFIRIYQKMFHLASKFDDNRVSTFGFMEGGDFEATPLPSLPGSGLRSECLNAYPIRPGGGGECPRRFQLSRTSVTFK